MRSRCLGPSFCGLGPDNLAILQASAARFQAPRFGGMLAREFTGTSRYRVLRRIGAGGCGIVYEAFDAERKARVALKTLVRLDAGMLYRFKQEFRALADVTHPNLVQLHELVSHDEEWFFTMELVSGTDVLGYVWREAGGRRAFGDGPPSGAPLLSMERVRVAGDERAAPKVDFDRLRASFEQLALGVGALHEAGKLHRDIKPSNVLVSHEGRVVLVDFGIVTDVRGPGEGPQENEVIVGTPAYMAPEQGALDKLTPAADWYAVGAVLYKALTGRPPFAGDTAHVLFEKQRREPSAPSSRAAGIPPELDELCVDLLRMDPRRRPGKEEVIARLRGALRSSERTSLRVPRREAVRGALPPGHTGRGPLVGRAEQLAALGRAFAEVATGRPVVALVEGAPGLGKTVLARSFADRIAADDRGRVLVGRCYERESVPYKAFDSVVDALTHSLLALPAHEQDRATPRDAAALARLFPVLERVSSFASAPRRGLEGVDGPELRRRAFAALRELVGRLAARKPVVLFVDDLHWCDADSVALLRALLAPPDAPAVLLLATVRDGHAERNDALRTLLDSEQGIVGFAPTHHVPVGALSPGEAVALAAELLGAEGERAPSLAVAVAAESHGHPLLLSEIVRHVQSSPERTAMGALRLDEVLQARIRELVAPARTLLEILAVAGRPLPNEVAFLAAQLDEAERGPTLSLLRASALVRVQGSRNDDAVECAHDRIREAALALLDEGMTREHHGAIGRALLRVGHGDPESLFLHFHAAGDFDRACAYAIAAGKRAANALAFDRASQFFRAALELLPPNDPLVQPLRVELGDALAWAGRGGEAAEAYLGAVATAAPEDALTLERRAAEELLFSGHVDRGLDVITRVLTHFGLRFSASRGRALALVLALRAWLAVRGLGFRERDARELSPTALLALDVGFTVALGVAVVDTIFALPFATRNLLASLRVGDPLRVCRALCLELCFTASQGPKSAAKIDAYVRRASELAERVGTPEMHALVVATAGLTLHFRGEWRAAAESMTEGLARYGEVAVAAPTAGAGLTGRHVSLRWELATFRYFSLAALVQLGELGEAAARCDAFAREARERGNLYLLTNLSIGDTNVLYLAKDQPDEAELVVRQAMETWSRRAFQMQHWWELQALCQADLYRGRGPEALARIHLSFGALQRSMLLRVQYLRLRAYHLRGRAALAATYAVSDKDVKRLLEDAERDAGRILTENVFWASPMALLLLSGIEARRGRDARARQLAAEAADGFDAAEMAVWGQVARRRLGELTDGGAGDALVRGADDALRGLGVVRPDLFARLLAPGFGR